MRINSSDIAEITNGKLVGPADLTANDIVTDSRQLSYTEGLVFFAIKGKNHDGHLFIDNLYQKGIMIFVVERSSADFIKNIPMQLLLKPGIRLKLSRSLLHIREKLLNRL